MLGEGLQFGLVTNIINRNVSEGQSLSIDLNYEEVSYTK